jgi:hypothetical protein
MQYITLGLVDPNYRLCSTRNVPPQQHEWWAEMAMENAQLPLPAELRNMIMDMTGEQPMSLRDAKVYRRERDQLKADLDVAAENDPSQIIINFE